jgi:hypothetical protein
VTVAESAIRDPSRRVFIRRGTYFAIVQISVLSHYELGLVPASTMSRNALSVDVTVSSQSSGLPNLLRRATAAVYVSVVRGPRGCIDPVSQEKPGRLPSLRSVAYSRTRSCSNPSDFPIRRPRSLVRVCARLPPPRSGLILSQAQPSIAAPNSQGYTAWPSW